MLEINNLIAGIPDILVYIVPGYIFLYILYFVSIKDINKCNNVIMKSVVASYIFILLDKLVCKFRGVSVDNPNILWIIAYSIILAYIVGLIVKSKLFNVLLRKINIHRTMNTNIWDDIHEEGMYLLLIPENDERLYLGQCEYCGEGDMSNLMVLSHYQELDKKGNVLQDFSKNTTRKVILDITKCSRIELFYEEKMPITKALKMAKESLLKMFK